MKCFREIKCLQLRQGTITKCLETQIFHWLVTKNKIIVLVMAKQKHGMKQSISKHRHLKMKQITFKKSKRDQKRRANKNIAETSLNSSKVGEIFICYR